jgi:hypothetical protein
MRATKHDWTKLDPLIARLMAEGWSEQAACKEVGIKRTTYRYHREALEGTPDTAAVQRPVQPTDTSVDTGAEQSAEQMNHRGAEASAEGTPVQPPVQRIDTAPVSTPVQIPVQRFEQLEGQVQALAHAVRSIMERMNHTPVHEPVQITTTPAYPKGKAIRWNLWILEPIRDELASVAAEWDLSPSQLVQEVLWKFLNDERPGG